MCANFEDILKDFGDMSDVQKLFACQASLFHLESYTNEIETMRLWQQQTPTTDEWCRKMTIDCLSYLLQQQQNTQLSEESMRQQSQRLREEGNNIFQSKGEQRDLLAVCRLYTRAILIAPAASEALALAHANRAMALQEYGYFQQAYDDCECALAQGYPSRMRHKLIMRQAYCAWQMCDAKQLKKHLQTLTEIQLNSSFTHQLEKLQVHLQKLQQCDDSLNEEIVDTKVSRSRETQQIQSNNDITGRTMVASVAIDENELIFTERASSFVPVGNWCICQQCAATQLIPFPCTHCRGRVVYCSLECLQKHAPTHSYECAAYQRELFSHIGISHLAFRMLLDGLPEMQPALRHKRNAQELWLTLVADSDNANSGSFHQPAALEYKRTIGMITHLGNMSLADIKWFAVVAQLLVVYLQEFTRFFETINQDTDASIEDWQLLTGALILRHIGQLIVNGHSCISIVRQRNKYVDPLLDMSLLADGIWCAPYRVKRGQLHKFCDYDEVAAANFPYLSNCNHACVQSFQPQFSGRYVTTYATKHIEALEQIFNCYTLDYRKSKQQVRRTNLQDVYHFVCRCCKCEGAMPDEDYERHHRYRCEKSGCGKIFVPELPELPTLNWWSTGQLLCPEEYLRCSHCNAAQHYQWLQQFNNLLKCAQQTSSRHMLYKRFSTFDKWLLDYHELKLHLSRELVSVCFAALDAGALFENSEFPKIVSIMQFYLRGIAAQSRVNSIEYVVQMTYLWDLIALKKYNCKQHELQEMLKAVNIASEEMKNIFMHYYEDYMKSLISGN